MAAVLYILNALVRSRVGLAAIVAVLMVLFYEGAPIGPLRYVPVVGKYAMALLDGRVDRVRQQAMVNFENEARARAMALIEKASKDHAEISSMDKSRACVELGGEWVPNPGRCD